MRLLHEATFRNASCLNMFCIISKIMSMNQKQLIIQAQPGR